MSIILKFIHKQMAFTKIMIELFFNTGGIYWAVRLSLDGVKVV
jgi:hypothetical protein